MKKISKYFVFIFCIILYTACTKDFIQKDIKGDLVSVIAPNDNLVTPNNSITFWWNELEGAEKYNLQIVKPKFDSIIQLIVDTNVVGDKFSIILSPGIYQWRIKGVNGGGSTSYVTRKLVIDTTSNLSFSTVSVLSPFNSIHGSNIVNFSWSQLPFADYYEIEVLNSNGSSVYNKNHITTLSDTYTFSPISANYSWKIKAYNSFSFSSFSIPVTFTVDLTSPVVSQLVSPISGSTVHDSVYFKWTRMSNDTKYDSIIVSTDSIGISTITAKRVNDIKYKINQLPTSLPSPGPSIGYYWWRIISVDSVKNKSLSSQSFKFKLN